MTTRAMIITVLCIGLLAIGGGIIWKKSNRSCNPEKEVCTWGSNNNRLDNNSNHGTDNFNFRKTNDEKSPTPTPDITPVPEPTRQETPIPPLTPVLPKDTGSQGTDSSSGTGELLGEVLNLNNKVFFPTLRSPLARSFTGNLKDKVIGTDPEGHARIAIESCILHFFSDKKNNGTLSYAPRGTSGILYLLKVGYGVLTNNCGKKVLFKQGDRFATIDPNGTWFAVAQFANPQNKSEIKTMVIVFEGDVDVKAVQGLSRMDRNIKSREFMFFTSGNQSFDNNGNVEMKVIKIPDNYEAWKELYAEFNMKDWIGTVTEIYEVQRKKDAKIPGTTTDDKNESRVAVPNPRLSPDSPIEFKDLVLGEEAKKTVTFINESPLDLGLFHTNLSSGLFSIDLKDCGTISKINGTCEAEVIFKPLSVDPVEEDLIINHNADKDGKMVLKVKGTGKLKDDDNSGSDTETSLIIPPIETFPVQDINTLGVAKTIPIEVKGEGRIKIGKLSVNAQDYQLKEDFCSGKTIDEKTPCTISVVFNPKSADERQGTITIPAQKVMSGNQVSSMDLTRTVSLKGNGVSLKNPSTVSFDKAEKKVKVKNPKIRAEKDISLEQEGSTQVTINKVEVVTSDGSKLTSEDFRVTKNTCLGDIKNNCVVTIGFTPQKRKLRRGTVLIYYNSLPNPKAISVSGFGKHRCWFLRPFFKSK